MAGSPTGAERWGWQSWPCGLWMSTEVTRLTLTVDLGVRPVCPIASCGNETP